MGTAILSAAIDKEISKPEDITVSDISGERLTYLEEKYGVSVTGDNSQAIHDKDVIVFSIKPQTLPEVMPELKDTISNRQLVLSIMAGVKIETLVKGLSHNAVVRVMPNTPAQVYEGMSVWTATADVTEEQKKQAESILGSIGRQIYVEDEKYLDMVTAVSGSGPAYFFLFVEALIEAGIKIGLSHEISYELVLQTLIGSGKLIRESGKAPSELKTMVTSKGGTTAAALQVFENGKFNDLVIQAIKAAYDRSIELGKG